MLDLRLAIERGAEMNDNNGSLTRLVLLCGQCNCGCPELLVDHEAPPERRIVITDDFGQRVQMSADQLQVLIDEARSGRLDEVLAGLGVG
jgi:hypothetical protein